MVSMFVHFILSSSLGQDQSVSSYLVGVSLCPMPQAQDVSHEYGNFLLNSNIPIWLQTFIFFTHEQVSSLQQRFTPSQLVSIFHRSREYNKYVTYFYKCQNDKKSFICFHKKIHEVLCRSIGIVLSVKLLARLLCTI